MGRNKLIYAHGDWAVVVAAEAETGGTWAGAVECLRSGWTPVFVRSGDARRPVIYASGGIGFLNDMLTVAGGTNVFAEVRVQAVQASTEQILAKRPDVVLETRAANSAFPPSSTYRRGTSKSTPRSARWRARAWPRRRPSLATPA